MTNSNNKKRTPLRNKANTMSSSHTSKYSSRSTPQSMSSNQRSAHFSDKSSTSANAFVQDIHSRLGRAEQEEREIKKKLVPRLAKRACKLIYSFQSITG